MARKHRNKRRRSRRAARLGNPRRTHIRNRRSRRGMGLFNRRHHRNPALGDLTTALLAGGAGYVVSKGFAVLADNYLPAMVPERAMIGSGLAAVGTVWLGETFLKDRPRISAAASVGAMIPLAEEIIKKTPLGPMIGLYETSPDLPGSGAAAMLPAPGGVSAALAAALGADLGGEGRWAASDY